MTDADGGPMAVTVVLHPLLTRYSPRVDVARPQVVNVPAGSNVDVLLTQVCGLPQGLPVFIALNGHRSGPAAALRSGDRVRVFMPLSGG